MAAKKKTGGTKSGSSSGSALLNAVAGSISTDTLVDFVERLGVVDLVVGRLKTKLEETDIDELFDEAADYLKRNPEVLVVSLGAITVATGMLVWLNARREWDGEERRNVAPIVTTTGRVRKAS
jgi:hypothetical protein